MVLTDVDEMGRVEKRLDPKAFRSLVAVCPVRVQSFSLNSAAELGVSIPRVLRGRMRASGPSQYAPKTLALNHRGLSNVIDLIVDTSHDSPNT